LAQSNPDLLNQLTNEAFYGNSAGPFASQHDQQYNTINNINNNNNSNNNINKSNNDNTNPNSNSNAGINNSDNTNYIINNNSPNPSATSCNQYQSFSFAPSVSAPMSLAMDTTDHQQQATRTINQVTNSISNITHTADALNQDIDDLGISLQALAHHLGFDPTKVTPADDEKIDENEGDLLDMDEFLNTYGKDNT
jgi:hypothetical protein